MRIEDGPRSRTFVVFFLSRKSHTFEDISEPSECPRVDILSFFPAPSLWWGGANLDYTLICGSTNIYAFYELFLSLSSIVRKRPNVFF